MKKTLTAMATGLCVIFTAVTATAEETKLPDIDKAHTAIVITDPQNDFLDEKGKLYKTSA